MKSSINLPKTLSIWCLLLLILGDLKAQKTTFSEFIIEDGLTSINTILIDSYGYKWFGGTHGLYRHDGYDFDIFKFSSDDDRSLSSNDINTLFEDDNHNIWIGLSKSGVNVFERETERMIRLPNIPELASSTVTDFVQDASGNTWIGTLKNGIFVLDMNYRLLKRFTHNILAERSLSNDDVFDFLIDSQNNFWIVTNSGALDLYRTEDSSFSHYPFVDKTLTAVRSGQKLLEAAKGKIWIGTEGEGIFEFDVAKGSFQPINFLGNGSVNSNIITGLGKDSKDDIWISTDGGGLYSYQLDSGTFAHHQYDEQDEFGISNNAFYSLLIDPSDRIWLGMGNGKVNVSNEHPFHFIREGNGISFNVVVDLLIDHNRRLWVATGGGGLDVIDLGTGQLLFNFNEKNESFLQTNILLTLHEDKEHNIWAGTFLGGINQWSESGRIKQHFAHQENSNSLSNDHIFDIVEDEDGKIWLATQGGGIDCLNPQTGIFNNYSTENRSGLVSNRIQSLFSDSQNRLWAGHFFGGLQLFDRQKNKFVSVELPDQLHQRIRQYPIHAICQDSHSNLLIASGGLGLVVLDSMFQQYTVYDQKAGLPSNAVYGVLDFKGAYWLSTNLGLVKINRHDNEIRIIDKSDGLITSDFEAGAIVADEQMEQLYFGSKEGVVYFQPDLLHTFQEKPTILFTDLEVLNRSIMPGDTLAGKVLLDKSLSFSEHIQLPYSQNSFSLSFACPKFEKPGKLLYRYQLEGWEDRWLIAEPDRRFASYTNVDYGKYLFIVQASADGGQNWTAEESLQIVISPPFYQARWAYVVYLLLITGILFSIYHFIRGRIALRNQLNIEKFSREKDNDLNREKINFFTNISHEIRTPLTLMLGHLERLSNFENLEQKFRQELNLINKNGNRLLILVNQLLDFRKMEMGQLELRVSCQNIIPIIREILLPFRELAIHKNISLQFRDQLPDSLVYFDASKLEIILYNLLSNALKFTPPYGRIEVSVSEVDEMILLSVSDTGEGIAKENLDKIFRPFFQGEAGGRRGMKGTGIGLSLVREVVKLHHGSISVESEDKQGATFKVCLPKHVEAYTGNEIVELRELSVKQISPERDETVIEHTEKYLKLLLVEDNEEILHFLKSSFLNSYDVLTANDGRAGLEIALETIPDLIVSDVMMPEMDGMEMCRHLKKDIRTNHIPIILLTARTGFLHEHSGLDTGADDYITKPFQLDLLRIRILNLIENRKRVHLKIRRDFLMEPQKVAVQDPNEQFIVDVMDLIEENIADEEYSVKKLAHDMGISHSVLYRKIQALTNMTVNNFVKSVRLKKAAQLLQTGAYSISEVAYQTGFTNPKYFSTCFGKEFGQTPSEFQQNFVLK